MLQYGSRPKAVPTLLPGSSEATFSMQCDQLMPKGPMHTARLGLSHCLVFSVLGMSFGTGALNSIPILIKQTGPRLAQRPLLPHSSATCLLHRI